MASSSQAIHPPKPPNPQAGVPLTSPQQPRASVGAALSSATPFSPAPALDSGSAFPALCQPSVAAGQPPSQAHPTVPTNDRGFAESALDGGGDSAGSSGSKAPAPPAAGVKPSVSYASVVAKSTPVAPSSGGLAQAPPAAGQVSRQGHPRFPPLKLPKRQVSSKDGKPSISFTASEIGACEKRFEHSIIAKFTVGRPSISDIKETFLSNWALKGRASISGIWDGRHILVILDSEEDVRTVLSSPLNKVGHAFFRLFRWSPDYNPKRESTVTTIWVRLPGLPLSIYDSSFVEAIISTFGFFVSVDDRTKTLSSLKFARACVELDVTKPIPDAIWINMPDNKSYWQPIEVESKLSYCNRCRVHGHSSDQCRKKHGSRLVNRAAPKEAGLQCPTAPGDVGVGVIVENVSLEKETGVGGDVRGDDNNAKDGGDTSKEDEVSIIQEATSFEIVPDTANLAMVVYNDPLDIDTDVQSPVSTSLLQIEAPGEFSPPISEWIPSKKKRKNKGKKVAPSESVSALRYSSQVIQAVPNCLGIRHSSRSKKSSENSDFVYANGMKSEKGKPRKKVSFNQIAEVMSFVEDEE